jgi:hypothetical protein
MKRERTERMALVKVSDADVELMRLMKIPEKFLVELNQYYPNEESVLKMFAFITELRLHIRNIDLQIRVKPPVFESKCKKEKCLRKENQYITSMNQSNKSFTNLVLKVHEGLKELNEIVEENLVRYLVRCFEESPGYPKCRGSIDDFLHFYADESEWRELTPAEEKMNRETCLIHKTKRSK